jgi:integrase
MTKMRLLYIQEFIDQGGKVRRYFRKRGMERIPLPGAPGSPEFDEAYKTARGGNKPAIGEGRTIPGTVNAAVVSYLRSAAFLSGAPDTRRTRKNILERFRAEHGDKRIAMLDPGAVERMVKAKALTPSAARNFLNTLRVMMAHCLLEGMIKTDPTHGVKAAPIKTTGYKTWPDRYVEAYRARHPIGTKARFAFELLACTGAARADVVRMGRQHIRDGEISFRRHKTNVLVEIPALPELQIVLDQLPLSDSLTFLMTEQGKPFTDAGFGNWFRDRCSEAGIPVGYSAHGVRKYAATWHANRGATAHQLMAWFGWLTIREAERYTREAGRRSLARGMVQKLAP